MSNANSIGIALARNRNTISSIMLRAPCQPLLTRYRKQLLVSVPSRPSGLSTLTDEFDPLQQSLTRFGAPLILNMHMHSQLPSKTR